MPYTYNFGGLHVASASRSCGEVGEQLGELLTRYFSINDANVFTYHNGCSANPVVAGTGVVVCAGARGSWGATCGTYVVSSVLDSPSDFELTPEGGAQIAAAVLAVWVVAWAFRMLISAVNLDERETS